MKMKLAIDEIGNGYVVTGPEEVIYRERAVDAVTQARVYLDAIAKELQKPPEKR